MFFPAVLLVDTAVHTARQSHDLAGATDGVIRSIRLAHLGAGQIQTLLQLRELGWGQLLVNPEIEVQALSASPQHKCWSNRQGVMDDLHLLLIRQASIALDEDHPAAVDVVIAGTPNLEPCGLGEVLRLGPPVSRFRQGWVHHHAKAVVVVLPQGGLHLILWNHPICDVEVDAAAATLLGWKQHEHPLAGGFCEL